MSSGLRQVSRRSFLRDAGVAGGMALSGSWLCGSVATATPSVNNADRRDRALAVLALANGPYADAAYAQKVVTSFRARWEAADAGWRTVADTSLDRFAVLVEAERVGNDDVARVRSLHTKFKDGKMRYGDELVLAEAVKLIVFATGPASEVERPELAVIWG